MKIPAVLVVGAPQNHWADRRSIAVCRVALLRRRPPALGQPMVVQNRMHRIDDPSTGIRIKPRQPLRILDAAQRAPACCALPASRSERGAGWHVGRAAATIGQPARPQLLWRWRILQAVVRETPNRPHSAAMFSPSSSPGNELQPWPATHPVFTRPQPSPIARRGAGGFSVACRRPRHHGD